MHINQYTINIINEKQPAIKKGKRQPKFGIAYAQKKPVKIAPSGHPACTKPTLKSRFLLFENSDAVAVKVGKIPPIPNPVINRKANNCSYDVHTDTRNIPNEIMNKQTMNISFRPTLSPKGAIKRLPIIIPNKPILKT